MRPDVAVREPGLGERLGELVSERPLLVVATGAVVLVGALGAYLVLRPARADGTADARPTASATPERIASPALASPFRVHTSQHAGLRVRLPPDFDSDPDPTSMQHGNDGRKVWLAFYRRGTPKGPMAYAAHVAPGAEDTGAGRDDGGEKLVAFVRAASQSFLLGMGARTDVQTASMDQCAMVVGPAARIASCSGVYRGTNGNGPVGLSCQRRGATYYCFGWVGDPGVGPGELDAIAATLEPLLAASCWRWGLRSAAFAMGGYAPPASIHRVISARRTGSGRLPLRSTASWNRRRSKRVPNRVCASFRSAAISR